MVAYLLRHLFAKLIAKYPGRCTVTTNQRQKLQRYILPKMTLMIYILVFQIIISDKAAFLQYFLLTIVFKTNTSKKRPNPFVFSLFLN